MSNNEEEEQVKNANARDNAYNNAHNNVYQSAYDKAYSVACRTVYIETSNGEVARACEQVCIRTYNEQKPTFEETTEQNSLNDTNDINRTSFSGDDDFIEWTTSTGDRYIIYRKLYQVSIITDIIVRTISSHHRENDRDANFSNDCQDRIDRVSSPECSNIDNIEVRTRKHASRNHRNNDNGCNDHDRDIGILNLDDGENIRMNSARSNGEYAIIDDDDKDNDKDNDNDNDDDDKRISHDTSVLVREYYNDNDDVAVAENNERKNDVDKNDDTDETGSVDNREPNRPFSRVTPVRTIGNETMDWEND